MWKTIFAGFFLVLFASAGFGQVMSIQVDDKAIIPVQMTSTQLDNGDLKFVGEKVIEIDALKHKVAWDIVLNGSSVGQVNEQIIKTSSLKVDTDPASNGTTNFTVEFHLPSKAYTGMTLAGGGQVKLVSNADGGQLTCSNQPTGSTMISPLLDGQPIESPVCAAFYCPFLMSMGGAGSGATSFLFAQTCQGQKPRNLVAMIGERLRVGVSAGEKLTVSVGLSAAGITPVVVACPEDLNGDKKIDGADQGILLGAWGPCDGCKADLNKDGKVDGADLGILLGAWGKNCQ